MQYNIRTETIFQEKFQLFSSYPFFIHQPAVIAYSGGKDSTLLLHFYSYLHSKGLVPTPILYHLNHSIRNNAEQEKELIEYSKQVVGFLSYFKKKTFLSYLITSKKV